MLFLILFVSVRQLLSARVPPVEKVLQTRRAKSFSITKSL